jgi:hypothetical protein
MKRHTLDLEPGRSARRGINATGILAVLVFFAASIVIGNWADGRLQAPRPAAKPRASGAPQAASQSSGKVQTLTLEPERVPETSAQEQAADEPAQAAPRDSAQYENNLVITDAPVKPARQPAPAASPSAAAPAASSRPSPARSVSPPAPPQAAAAVKSASPAPKPPAQSNPAMKPASSKPTAVSAAAPDTVVRVKPPANASASDPFYSVRLNKAESKVLADVVADTLKKHGFDDAAAVRTPDGQYSVKVGDFNFRYAAENAKKQLQDLGFQETYIEEKTVAE